MAVCNQKRREPPGRLTMFWARAVPASHSLTFIDRAWAGPAPQALTFIDRAWASPAPQSLTFIDRNPSLLSTGPGQPGPQPLTSIGQTPHFYWPSQPAPIQKIVSPPNHRCNCSAPNSKH